MCWYALKRKKLNNLGAACCVTRPTLPLPEEKSWHCVLQEWAHFGLERGRVEGLPKPGPVSLMSRWQSIVKWILCPWQKPREWLCPCSWWSKGTVNKTHTSHHLSEGLRQALSPEVPQELSQKIREGPFLLSHVQEVARFLFLISLPFVSSECEVTPTVLSNGWKFEEGLCIFNFC